MDSENLTNTAIADLLRQSAASRETLLSEAQVLRHRLDVPARIKASLADHPIGWMLGTAGAGLLVSLLLRRRPVREEKRSRGVPSMLLGLALTAARPLLKSWLTGQLGRLASGISSRPSVSHIDPTSRNIF